MNTPGAVLDALRAVGGAAAEEGGRVVYRAPRGAVTPELRAALRANRDGLLELLRGGVPPTSTALLDTPAGGFQNGPTHTREEAPAPGLAAILAAELVRATCRRVELYERERVELTLVGGRKVVCRVG